jgi:hypothetical protein
MRGWRDRMGAWISTAGYEEEETGPDGMTLRFTILLFGTYIHDLDTHILHNTTHQHSIVT